MPWLETNAVKERQQFVADLETGQWTMSELCAHYGVSRPTGYKWVDRYEAAGGAGLRDRSRAPRSCPHKTPEHVVRFILQDADKYGWGARKVLKRLSNKHPELELPARSTVFDILERHGRVRHRRRRKRYKHPGAVPIETAAANDVWTADFKGQFRTRNGVYCYPLTIVDHHSRFLLGCEGLLSVKTVLAKPVFRRLFGEVGLPLGIRTDNGPPFASNAIHGLTSLNVWWMQLGIVHQRIDPGCPQQNGAHERMHRTLKARTTRPPRATRRQQQLVFNKFQREFNEERPHEALDDEVPASLWKPSPRHYPEQIRSPEYPGHFEVRRVSESGTFRINNSQIFLSNPLINEYIGLEEINDGIWNIVYYDTLLGRVDERTKKITGAHGSRKKV